VVGRHVVVAVGDEDAVAHRRRQSESVETNWLSAPASRSGGPWLARLDIQPTLPAAVGRRIVAWLAAREAPDGSPRPATAACR
jgi:hypothetical protein